MSADIDPVPPLNGSTIELNELHDSRNTELVEVTPRPSPRDVEDEEVVVTGGEDDDDEEEKKEEEETRSLSFGELFKYTTTQEKFLYALGFFSACVVGGLIPCFSIIFGYVLDGFNSSGDFMKNVEKGALFFVYFGCGSAVFSFLEIFIFMRVSENVAKRVRSLYLRSLLRQDIAYHDTLNSGELAQRLTTDTQKYQAAISDKLGLVIQSTFGFVAAIGIAFYYGWELSLVILSGMPQLLVASALMGTVMVSTADNELKNYRTTNNTAYEALSNIKTMLNNQLEKSFLYKYQRGLDKVTNKNISNSYLQAASYAGVLLAMLLTYSLTLYYGALILKENKDSWPGRGKYSPGDVITIFYALVTAFNMIGNVAPHMGSVASGMAAGCYLYDVIERESQINPESELGLKISVPTLNPVITFHNVTFAYPTRKEQNVLKGLNITFQSGFNALVGSSGCGKSSLIALIQRLYDVDAGFISIKACVRDCTAVKLHQEQFRQRVINSTVDNDAELMDLTHVECVPYNTDKTVPEGCVEIDIDIRQINLKMYRSAIGLVQQEPALFSGTIAENIKYGNRDMSDEHMKTYAKMANAHEFIESFPFNYNTMVEGKSSLSGGQRQRIAIARSLALNNSIMLFDEATSALDNKSEKEVQKSIDALLAQEASRTSIVIAHRLTTIRNARAIYIMDQGLVIESGTHDQLMEKDGFYASLVKAGDSGVSLDNDEDEEENKELADSDAVTEPTLLERQQSFISESRHATEDTRDLETDPLLKPNQKSGLSRLMSIIPLQGKRMTIGTICGIIEGGTFPIYAYLMGKATTNFYIENKSLMMSNIEDYCVYFLILAIGAFIFCFLRYVFIIQAGEHLTRWTRFNVFKTLIHQEPGYHDSINASVLSTRLATDCSQVKSMVVDKYGVIVNTLSNVAVTMAFSYSLEPVYATIMMFVVFPLLSVSGYAQFKAISGFASKSKDKLENASKLAIESLNYVRTVTIFNQQEFTLQCFDNILDEGKNAGTATALYGSLCYSVGNFLIYGSYALSFYIGGLLVERGHLTFEQMITIFFSVEVSSMLMGQLFHGMSDYTKGAISLSEVFNILDRPTLSPTAGEGSQPDLFVASTNGVATLEIENLRFHYPTRPANDIINGLSFSCESNKVTALVGASGCGKSTLFGLQQRHYDPIEPGATYGYSENYSRFYLKPYLEAAAGLNYDNGGKDQSYEEQQSMKSTKDEFDKRWKVQPLKPPKPGAGGRILVNGHDISEIDIRHYRNRVATVDQEPVQFSGTVYDNIVGKDDEGDAKMEHVIAAAKMANLHNLVIRFPKGYDTHVGNSKNSKLSGGQKQRQAIARALYSLGLGLDEQGNVMKRFDYNTLLLLDEATSALDAISQKLVQQAIDRAMECTTVIIIAHRLSTIQNADNIVVFDEGQVAEQGSHAALMSKKGLYFKFVGTHDESKTE